MAISDLILIRVALTSNKLNSFLRMSLYYEAMSMLVDPIIMLHMHFIYEMRT
jgi:hypothetical protein